MGLWTIKVGRCCLSNRQNTLTGSLLGRHCANNTGSGVGDVLMKVPSDIPVNKNTQSAFEHALHLICPPVDNTGNYGGNSYYIEAGPCGILPKLLTFQWQSEVQS